MASRAKDFEILEGVVVGISISVVHTKDPRFISEATPGALFKVAPIAQRFSRSTKTGLPGFAGLFIYATAAAIDAPFGWRSKESFRAVAALDCHRALQMLGFVVALA
jgi:hypothetical protein